MGMGDGDRMSDRDTEKPITISGTWDDGGAFPDLPAHRQDFAIVQSRRFLWWTVTYSTSRAHGEIVWDKSPISDDGTVTYAARFTGSSPFVLTLHPWWERALYRIAGLWSHGEVTG